MSLRNNRSAPLETPSWECGTVVTPKQPLGTARNHSCWKPRLSDRCSITLLHYIATFAPLHCYIAAEVHDCLTCLLCGGPMNPSCSSSSSRRQLKVRTIRNDRWASSPGLPPRGHTHPPDPLGKAIGLLIPGN